MVMNGGNLLELLTDGKGGVMLFLGWVAGLIAAGIFNKSLGSPARSLPPATARPAPLPRPALRNTRCGYSLRQVSTVGVEG